jgi:hypothetical protein
MPGWRESDIGSQLAVSRLKIISKNAETQFQFQHYAETQLRFQHYETMLNYYPT